MDICFYETFSKIIKALSLKRLRFLPLSIRPQGLCTQAWHFNNFSGPVNLRPPTTANKRKQANGSLALAVARARSLALALAGAHAPSPAHPSFSFSFSAKAKVKANSTTTVLWTQYFN